MDGWMDASVYKKCIWTIIFKIWKLSRLTILYSLYIVKLHFQEVVPSFGPGHSFFPVKDFSTIAELVQSFTTHCNTPQEGETIWENTPRFHYSVRKPELGQNTPCGISKPYRLFLRFPGLIFLLAWNLEQQRDSRHPEPTNSFRFMWMTVTYYKVFFQAYH